MKTTILGIVALAAVVAVPGLSLAATYAYVNTAGEVMTIDAATPSQAISSAPGIHMHSGVILVNGTDDAALVGDDVPVN